MNSTLGMLEGALAVRYCRGSKDVFPLEIGAAVPGSSMSAITRPIDGGVALDPLSEEALGLSLIEAEATGLAPEKVCEALNEFLVGRRVNCSTAEEARAVANLFRFCAVEMEFDLATLDDCAFYLPVALPEDHYPEMIARDIFQLARPRPSLCA